MLVRILSPLLLLLLMTPVIAQGPLEDVLGATFRLAERDRSGTGFLVLTKAADSGADGVVLVTAAHVFEQMGDGCDWIARFEQPDGTFLRKVEKLTLREGGKPRWKRHPELDIAALRLQVTEGVSIKSFPFEQLTDEMSIKARQVRVGQETFIPCFPAKLEGNEAGWPVLRKGSIATYPLAPVRSAKTILVDYNAFGGDSGAPVVVVTDQKPLVVGLVLGMHRQTDRAVLPFEERTMHTPLGMAMVAQAHFIRETIGLLKE